MRKYLVLLLVAAVAFFAVPAMAQAPAAPEKAVSFFAEVWYQAYWDQKDKDASGIKDKDGKAVEQYRSLSWGLDTTVTRVGMRVKQGDFSGAVVLNANTNVVAGDNSPHYREFWGEYNFGMFSFFFGHAYTITYQPAYMQARGGQNGFAGSTTFTANRSDHMKVTVPLGAAGTVAIAAVEPFKEDASYTTAPTANGPTQTNGSVTVYQQYKQPKFEALYNYVLKADPMLVDLKVFGGYQEWDYYVSTTNTKAFTLKSYAYGVNGKVVFGPATVQASFGMLKNGREYGASGGAGGDILYAVNYDVYANKTNDVKTTNGHIAAGFKINPMFTPQVGYGFNKNSLETENMSGVKTKKERTQSEFYANVLIQVTPQLVINPEYCVESYGKEKTSGATSTEVKKGKNTYFGSEFIYRF